MSRRPSLREAIETASQAQIAGEQQAHLQRMLIPRRRLPWVLVALLLVLGVLCWPIVTDMLQRPAGWELSEGRLKALRMAHERVRDYARTHEGAYPQRLEDVMPVTLGIQYRLTDTGFELSTTLVDGKLTTLQEDDP